MLTYSIWPGNYGLVIPKQLRELLAAAGWQKHDIQDYVYRRARVKRRDWAGVGKATIVNRGRRTGPGILRLARPGGPAGGCRRRAGGRLWRARAALVGVQGAGGDRAGHAAGRRIGV